MLNLKGKRGIVIGIANEKSIAWGCAKVIRKAGAELAITYLNDKAKSYVEPLAKSIDAKIFMPLDLLKAGDTEAFFDEVKRQWGNIDFLIHSLAYCPIDDLHGRVVDVSIDGFTHAMQVSCYSLIKFSKYAEGLMPKGGSILTMTYYGSEKIVTNYNIMGPVKAALESTVRYLALDLGVKDIRVNAISPGPILTRAASGIGNFDKLLGTAYEKAPIKDGVSIDDVGNMAAFLVSDMSTKITGSTMFVDCGSNTAA
ncbi:Enoyl-(acyl-carrier-protein) reductase (NADH) FabI [Alphaproteobacteria bacterium]